MNNNYIQSFYESGVYGLITDLNQEIAKDNSRAKAYNILKVGYQIAKKSVDERLHQLPPIAFDLSRHESIYRIAAFLYIELNDKQKALECLSYLHHYYQDQEIEPHNQYNLIKQQLNESYNEPNVNERIDSYREHYQQQKLLNSIKDYTEILPETDAVEQAVYFNKIYHRFGVDTVIASIISDVRFNDRQKAVLLIRASRAVALVAEEGPSIESLFANKALELDTSDTVVKNSYHAYLRAGNLNKLTQLKKDYSAVELDLN